MLITGLFDKLFFGLILVLALQLPQLTDHYQQFLSGLYTATKWQVDGYEATAKAYQYPDAKAMITKHLQNEEASVRMDAEQKLLTLTQFEELNFGLSLFQQGNLFEKSIYILSPSRFEYLQQTLRHFKPGIPLTRSGIGFGVVVALFVYYILALPFALWARRKKRMKLSHATR